MVGVIDDHFFGVGDARDCLFELAGTIANAVDSQVGCSDPGSFDVGQ
jgi:hypothetical protein